MSEIRVDNITDEEGTGSPNIIYDNAASGLTATSIKGAIDEVSGGAIVESGTNSNGSFVRWENGEQACFSFRELSVTLDSGETAFKEWIYPAEFDETVSLPVISVNPEGQSAGRAVEQASGTGSGGAGGSVRIAIKNIDVGNGVGFRLSPFGWGFWK